MPTASLGLPLILADQAQKHVTHNMALDLIDSAVPGVVVSATVTAPPAVPVEFSRYIVPAGASAAFGGVPAGAVAVRQAGAWAAQPMPFGARLFVADEGQERIRTAAGWLPGMVAGSVTGAAAGLVVRDAIVTLTGASVSVAGLIPARAIILGVTSWTIGAVTGATSYSVGDTSSASRFGASLEVAAGSSNIGVVGPFATYAPDEVRVTAAGGNFTGGRVGLAVTALMPSPAPVL